MEGQTGRDTVNMDPAIMRAVIKYVYTGTVDEMTGLEMEKLFKAAHICMLTGLQCAKMFSSPTSPWTTLFR